MKYTCIDKLANLLDLSNIPYQRALKWDGEQIRIEPFCDAVCHKYSKGHEYDLIEILGALTDKELSISTVRGYLTPEEVADRFAYCYRNKTSKYIEDID